MNDYELDRYVTNAIEDIISRIQAPANVLSYAVEPDIDDRYSIPFFIEVKDTYFLLHYFAYVNTSGEDITIKFQFDAASFHDSEDSDVNDFKLIAEGMNAVLDAIDTNNEIYI